jgi:hypothetical protein
MKYKYLSVGIDAKTVKGQKKGYLTGILYLAPHTIASNRSVCPWSTPACRSVCLYSAGRGGFNSVQQARIRKTKEFQADPAKFVMALAEDIKTLKKAAAKQGMIPAVRLNGTSDIRWELAYAPSHGMSNLFNMFPDVQFYDYTKWPASTRESLPNNYHLTFSHSESPRSKAHSAEWFVRGVNTAMVFRGGLPTSVHGIGGPYNIRVINGDESDLRFTDPAGVIVGLKAKGKARANEAGEGFVIQV